jgi:hypothetical protein
VIEIRSYRRVFDLERRVYSVDRLRLNPGGVPVRGVVYLLALLFVAVALADLPLIGSIARALPWYLRDLALPAAIATVLSVIRVEGRTFHLAAHALVRFWVGPSRLVRAHRRSPSGRCSCRWELVMFPDGSESRMRRLRYTGPGAVLVALEHERRGRAVEHGSTGIARRGLRPALILRESPRGEALDHAQVIALSPGARLLVRPDRSVRR